MKKLLSLLVCGLLLFGCGDKYDDSALRNDLNDLENRVTKLEELCKQMNTNISSLQKIVDALQDNLSISKVEQVSDGYIIHFSDGSTATIKNGKNSEDAPIIGVKKDTDGIYYWTLDGEWLTDEKGNKVKAQGTDGKDGVDGEDGNDGVDGEDGTDGTNGKDGITPQLKIENGRWMLSMDNGKTWTDIGQATGADGTDGEDGVDGKDGTNGIFKSVTEDNDNVYFTLEDDSVITIPKSDNSKFAIAFDTTDIAILNGGESKTISYTITSATENTVVKAIAQDGWKVKINTTSTNKGTITITAPNPIVESEILVFANDGSYRTVMVSLNCAQGQIIIADNSIDATPAGGTQEIKLRTNLDYTVEIPEDAQSWLSLVPQTRALREDTIVFEVTANEGIQRYATVALKGEQNNTFQTIIFRQLGTCTEIHVETKGELENVLADYDYANIESLKITGVLNYVDFLFIYHMMPNLVDLDIAEVNITALPTKAFYNSTNVEKLILPNTLTTIGEGMFIASKLKYVIIPNGVTAIEDEAFNGCRALTSIENYFAFLIIAVFISGLMVGRTPEFLGRKVEAREMKIATLVVLMHPFLILVGTGISAAVAAANPEIGWLNNPSFHGLSEMLYEYTSSAANNGSGFEGLADNTPFWNISTGIALIMGRYFPIVGQVAIAGLLASKKCIPESAGTLRTDTGTFSLMTFAVIIIVAALSFFPALALGPIADYLTF